MSSGRRKQAKTQPLHALKNQMQKGSDYLHSGKSHEALKLYQTILKKHPNHLEAWRLSGIVLIQIGHIDQGLQQINHALKLDANNACTYIDQGNALFKLGRFQEALNSYEKALSLKPEYAEAHFGLGQVLKQFKQLAKSLRHFQIAMELEPDTAGLLGTLLNTSLKTCSWNLLDTYQDRFKQAIFQNKPISQPFTALLLIDQPNLHKKLSQILIQSTYTNYRNPKIFSKKAPNQPIRIGYYSADFRFHPVIQVMNEVFEAHDQRHFEWIAFSLTPQQNNLASDLLKSRIKTIFHQFIEVHDKSDLEVAELSKQLGIDIAVDLNGFTEYARTGIFAAGCAPIQVNYLGYPGTTAAEYMDYIIADKTIIPIENQVFFTEKVAYLPYSYLVNSNPLQTVTQQWTRQGFGLPETSFVFCSFNNNSKILPCMFDGWMRILKAVPNSVLWLKTDNTTATSNLRQQAEQQGIDSQRLVFTEYGTPEEYVARRQIADLFLDTFPYNAHATAADALKAGLPVLTLMGQSFASRVAASLLKTVECPELITTSQADYEAKAIELANNPALLKSIRDKLIKNQTTSPLFDSTLMARHLEAIYQAMYDRYQKDLPPDVIEIKAITDLPQVTTLNHPLPENLNQPLQQAVNYLQSGKNTEALAIYQNILQKYPDHFESWHLSGVALTAIDQPEEALTHFDRALTIDSKNAYVYCDQGNAFSKCGQLQEALNSYKQAVTLAPQYTDAWFNQGNTHLKLNQVENAIECYQHVVQLNPNFLGAYTNLGKAYMQVKKLPKALECYDRVLSVKPDFAEIHNNRGNVLKGLNQLEEALKAYDQALALKPDYAEAYSNKGDILLQIKRTDEALFSCNKALAINSDCIEAYINKGNILFELLQFKEASLNYEKALSLNPDDSKTHFALGSVFNKLRQWEKSLSHYRKSLDLEPNMPLLYGVFLGTAIKICEWKSLDKHLKSLKTAITKKNLIIAPFTDLLLTDNPRLHKNVSTTYTEFYHSNQRDLNTFSKSNTSKIIRIGYYSADFRAHPVIQVMNEVFEAHDTNHFEWFAFSITPSDTNLINNLITNRVKSTFDQFFDVHDKSDTEVAQLSRELGIDIAVNLNGFTEYSRTGIFAAGCAPIQVNYLGYPGTMGAKYMDYIIADKTIIPVQNQKFYTEKVTYLPHSYLVNGAPLEALEKNWKRQDFGLPENVFIFCCFNNNGKILPATFDGWMRILKAIPNSILWLRQDNTTASTNLCQEAESRGIDSQRLIFASHGNAEEYLARRQMADLFLDTFPYNAHATAADALKAGLPVLTLMGQSFASRVAASLLNTVGCPELITTSLADYEAKAIELALNPKSLQSIKQKLIQNRSTSPLFDAPLMARHLEAAYQTMYDRYQQGLAPDVITVKPHTSVPIETPNECPTSPPALSIPQQLQQALHQLQSGQTSTGLAILQSILQQDPNHIESWHLSGVALIQLGHPEQALMHFNHALTLNPDHIFAHCNRGNALFNLGRFEDALDSFDQALRFNPRYAEAYYNRGNTLVQLNQLDDALDSYTQATLLKPDYAVAHNNLGHLLLKMQQFEAALDCFKQAIDIHPHYAEAHNNQGNALLKLKQPQKALACYECALTINPQYIDAYYNCGNALIALDRFEDALARYNYVLKHKPDFYEAYKKRGHVLFTLDRHEDALADFNQVLESNPNDTEVLLNRGNVFLSLNQAEAALTDFQHAVEHNDLDINAHIQLGNAWVECQELEKALACYDKVLQLQPDCPEAYYNQGNALKAFNRFDEAIERYKKAIEVKPDYYEAFYNLGNCFKEAEDYDNAQIYYQHALKIRPDSALAYNNLGNTLTHLEQFEEALDCYEKAILIKPDFHQAYNNLANIQLHFKRLEDALSNYDQAINIKPDYADAYVNKSSVFIQKNQFEKALTCCQIAIKIKADEVRAYQNLGVAFAGLYRNEEAIASYQKALKIDPNYLDSYNSLGIVLKSLGQYLEALKCYDQALSINPNFFDAYVNKADLFKSLNRLNDSLICFRKALEIQPSFKYIFGYYLYTLLCLCEWNSFDFDLTFFKNGILSKQSVSVPYCSLISTDDALIHRINTQIYTKNEHPNLRSINSFAKQSFQKPIRIGYYSADFRNHPVAQIMKGIFETHDPSQFEWYAFSLVPPHKQDAIYQNLRCLFKQFIDTQDKSDAEVAELSRELGIDIAINLNGYTEHSRTGIFAHGCAPIQINYLGYPGTMAAEYMDYIIADKTLIPAEQQEHFTEKVVYLPYSYLVSGAPLESLTREWTRQDFGLPESGFVFCCFNNNAKILPATFDGWMRILKAVSDSVLWLKEDNPTATSNLRKEAEARGVDPQRLIFAGYDSPEEYLARRQMADLFLDTFPYNAHATAADALKAGLPVLTLMGQSFASRVAASFLNTLGCPELITTSQADYEAKAFEFAQNPEVLQDIKQKLIQSRTTSPLFDSALMARHLEAAYSAMYERYCHDLPPDVIQVKNTPPTPTC